MVFGVLTATGDGAGETSGRSGPPYPDEAALYWASKFLQGEVSQIPPQVSALKKNGRTLYDVVRRGGSVWPAPRTVKIHRLKVLAGEADRWLVEADVGKGTYMRSVVRDWGTLLGHAVHLEGLERTRAGAFRIEEATGLDQLGEDWNGRLLSTADALTIPKVELPDHHRRAVASGLVLDSWPELEGYRGVVALVEGGQVVCVMEGPPWRYRKVFLSLGDGDGRHAAT
jgi:tRNA pseudouridine55 synthase